jgi:hypothetical protein
MAGNGRINMSDNNGIATAETEQAETPNLVELTAGEQQVIEQMRAERNRQEFINGYWRLCRHHKLTLTASAAVVDGRLVGVIDGVADFNG